MNGGPDEKNRPSVQGTAELVVPSGCCQGEAPHVGAWLPVESGGGPIESPSADSQVNMRRAEEDMRAILKIF
jgi:hypothetical protein